MRKVRRCQESPHGRAPCAFPYSHRVPRPQHVVARMVQWRQTKLDRGRVAVSQPRIFVSHSHKDDHFTQRLVDDLHAAGAQVWVDKVGITNGNFMQRIDEALQQCDWMVLVLTPDAIASKYVQNEVYTALHRVQQGYMRDVIPLLAAPCAPGSIPPQWDVLHRYDATRDFDGALGGLMRALQLDPCQAISSPMQGSQGAPPIVPAPPLSHVFRWLPPRLADLGFRAHDYDGVEVIIPPLCEVPAGEFLMGSNPAKDRKALDEEKPEHRVRIPTFQIARFPVTVAEYACLVRAGYDEPPTSGSVTWDLQLQRLDHPVICVSWHDAMAYAAWLADQTGELWRLPTEAEWGKAARWDPATRKSHIYPWGDAFDQARCNTGGSGKGATPPVGAFPNGASPCGAHDMTGNVWERTSSIYTPYPYRPEDGRERVDSTEHRVLRGGSWSSGPRSCRAAVRVHDHPNYFRDNAGFRLVRAALSP